ncbi:hypothetical protein BRCH_04192 [Candidatus Burkholderia brachyanthoides]|nr:hypothetical protein BRCH_04192 [Candidatus Burkholderia brachyanthoides]
MRKNEQDNKCRSHCDSTAGSWPGDAEEIWRAALRPIYELERSATPFAARIETWDLAGKMLLTKYFTKDEVQFKRTRRRIAASGVYHYLVHCLLGGNLASESAEGQQRVALNSIAVRDTHWWRTLASRWTSRC